MEGRLVALDREQIVAPLLIEDLLRRFILRVEGVGHHDLADQIQWAQQLAPGRDFVALGFRDHTPQEASRGVDRVDDLHPTVTDFFPVDDHHPILLGSQDLLLPPQEHALDDIVSDLMQDPAKGGLLGTAHVATAPSVAEAQRA